MVALHNFGTETQVLEEKERIAQGIFQKFLVVDNDDSSAGRSGGFGSTK